MKNAIVTTLFILSCTFVSIAQQLSVQSKDSLNDRPSWESYLYFKMKLNGVYDISGGIQGNETFNLNNVDVWGDDDTPNLWMDMHQSQVRLFGAKEVGGHRAIGYFEGDFWGGNNHFRLRMAYVNYRFFQFGQDWSFFGDKEIWPNVFDWDGPSSGIWRRNPGLIFYKETDARWKFELGFEQTQAQISFIDDLDSTFMAASGNPTPESIFTIKKSGDFGHIRLASILRFLHYNQSGENGYVTAFGGALSGIIKTNQLKGNPIQFQFVAGKGIASYIVSFDGAEYDAAPDGFGNMNAIPAFGGWISYEHWLSNIVHANIVVGLTGFVAEGISEFYVLGGDFHVSDGSINLDFFYGLINIMVDPFEDFTVGVEYNIGNKQNTYMGNFNSSTTEETLQKNRMAHRINFGLFYNF